MAVTRLWPVTARLGQVLDYATNPEKTVKANSKYSMADYQALRDVIAYAKDEEKTEQEFFCQGINCNVSTAREQFVTVKEQFGKPDGIQAYHGYLSFKETDITPELAQKIGMEFAERVWGKRHQVIVTTHLNTQHLHCHFVINSISFVDGKRCRETSWFKFYRIADEICKSYGISIIENPQRNPLPDYMTMKDKAGMPTPHNNMRQAIDYCIEHSTSVKDFAYNLRLLGYEYCLEPQRKYWTVRKVGSKKNLRLYRLGEDYTNERIIQRLKENQSRVRLEPFQKTTVRIRQYRLQTREQKIRKVGGLYGLYLHYCYKLGYLPKYKKQNSYRLHYLLRDDLMKLDELTEQVRLLGKHQITNSEQLFSYRASVEEEIKALTADRTHLRNEIRKVNIDDASLSKAKTEIFVISDRLKRLRKELRHCDSIAERSGVIRENLNTVLAEEEKTKRKENRNYEHRR